MLPLAFLGSPADIAIILVVALLVFGPKRLPEIGKQLGQAMREMRKITDELTGTMHSVHQEVESAYKPVLTPPHEYGNPYAGTSSATVEKAAGHRTYDQEPEDLMQPKVIPVHDDALHTGPVHKDPVKLEMVHAEASHSEIPAEVTDGKGH